MDPELVKKKQMDQAAGAEAPPQAAQPAVQPQIPNSAALAMLGGDGPSMGAELEARVLSRGSWSGRDSEEKQRKKADQWYQTLQSQAGEKSVKNILKGKGSRADQAAFHKAVEQLQREDGDLSRETLKMLKQGSPETAMFARRYRHLQKKEQAKQEAPQLARQYQDLRARQKAEKKREASGFRYQQDMARLDAEERELRERMAGQGGRKDKWRREEPSPRERQEMEKLARKQEKLDRERARIEQEYAATLGGRKEAKRFLKERQREREKARKDRR